MEKKNTHKLAAVGLTAAFGIFLLFGTLVSTELPRGLYGPPTLKIGYSPSYYDSLALLNPTLIWHYQTQCQDSFTLEDYYDQIERVGLTSMGREVLTHWQYPPFWVEYYSCAQRKKWEVEEDYDDVIDDFNFDGSHYGFFVSGEGEERYILNQGYMWYVQTSTCSADTILKGPYQTDEPAKYPMNDHPNYDWPEKFHLHETSRDFVNRFRVKANVTGHNPETVVFYVYLDYLRCSSGWPRDRVDTLTVTVADFNGSTDFEIFEWTKTATPDDSLQGFGYKIFWPDSVDLWVDWIEFMDKDLGYPLFVNDASQDTILGMIVEQCNDLENDYDEIVGWAQSDEPIRSAFDARQLIYNHLYDHYKNNISEHLITCK
ncbi:hypothetical protein CEE37_06990 [candidate division LCP-89 bacterium B3_LCP]|uniref:Uncharacterized protein n=1 Tax=candidate division LCP-89 bacterium B3_LCP TaxID=2012998 RepID=A0A532V0G7_UNCL8|nr:MAG: hypothetical protein CEE37_06990 [candidate division LCP-89 bacterium B3_LCP]